MSGGGGVGAVGGNRNGLLAVVYGHREVYCFIAIINMGTGIIGTENYQASTSI